MHLIAVRIYQTQKQRLEFKLLKVCLGTMSFVQEHKHIHMKFGYFHVVINLLLVIVTHAFTNTLIMNPHLAECYS